MSAGAAVTVAGAGALGLSAALLLADAGCTVTVCDPAARPSASAVAAGMLAPVFEAALDPETGGDLALLLAARNLWPAFAGRAGIDLDRSGTAAVGGEAWLGFIGQALGRLGLRGLELSAAALADLAPGVAPDLQGVLVGEDWRLEPRAALAALRRAAEAAGVAFSTAPARGRGAADWLVVATGADRSLADVAPELSHLSPIKGQILRFAQMRGGRVSLRGEAAYAVPGAGGLAVGATMEPGRADAEVDPAALRPLAEAAEGLFPALAGAGFSAAAGVRAATPDALPMAGFSSAAGVIVATGARRNGWLLAPLVAQAVAAYVTGGDAGPYARRLEPGRFAGRGAA